MSDRQARAEAEAQFGAPVPDRRTIQREQGFEAAALLEKMRHAGDLRRDCRMRLLSLAEHHVRPGPDWLSHCFAAAQTLEAWVAMRAAVHGAGFAIEALDRASKTERGESLENVIVIADRILAFADGGEND